MGFNNNFTRAALQRIISDPNVRRYANAIRQNIQKHPSAQRFANQASEYFSKAKNTTVPPGQQTTNSNFFSRAQSYWNQHRERVIGFLAANFMGVIFFFQFGQQIFHILLSSLYSNPDPHKIDEKRRKKEEKRSKLNRDTPTPLVLSLGNDISDRSAEQHQFATSFLFKIGDQTEFRSSLHSQNIAGANTAEGRTGEMSNPFISDLRAPPARH